MLKLLIVFCAHSNSVTSSLLELVKQTDPFLTKPCSELENGVSLVASEYTRLHTSVQTDAMNIDN